MSASSKSALDVSEQAGLGLPKQESLPAASMPSWLRQLSQGLALNGEIETPSGAVYRFSDEPPRFRVKFHSNKLLSTAQDEFSLGHAYVRGDIDFEGDLPAILDARDKLTDRFRLRPWLRFVAGLFTPKPAGANDESIKDHYNFGNDFYLEFIDEKYRFYSQCLFQSEDESLETAAEHKLESMFESLELKPGMRLLDIGAGWGGVFEYCSPRGVQVTSLTLVRDSHDYVKQLLRDKQLAGDVMIQDFLDFQPSQPYDGIVIFGVMEHIPQYRQFFEQAWRCLRPGGKIYIDASAAREKHSMSQFTRFYTWRGTRHSFMCLQEVIQEALYAGFEVVEAREETRDYELTMRHWAERFDRGRERITRRWGEQLYRGFRIYLWGGYHAFKTDRLQAYHVVVRRGAKPGPRPGRVKRLLSFLREIA